jgi:GNAT superfamily N-acetyltransferase
MEYRMLARDEITRIWTIDRSEHIDNIYRLIDGELRLEPHNIDAPGWPADTEPTYTPLLLETFERGGSFFAAFDGEQLAGLSVLDTIWLGPNRDLLQLEFMHVGRDYRGKGLGKTLFEQAASAARERGARGLYISATPSENTIHFYQGRGATLLAEPEPGLFALEPEDIHLECPV